MTNDPDILIIKEKTANIKPYFRAVYRITCLPTEDFYVGASNHTRKRIRQHFRSLSRLKHCNPKFQSLFNEHQAVNFSFDILDDCTHQNLEEAEKKWIYSLRPTINTVNVYFDDKRQTLRWLIHGTPCFWTPSNSRT